MEVSPYLSYYFGQLFAVVMVLVDVAAASSVNITVNYMIAGKGTVVISGVVLALASVLSLHAGVKMIVRRSCSPLKAVHRRNLTPEGERSLSLVCGPALLVVGVSFAVSSYLAIFKEDAASDIQAVIGVAGIALPALVILFAIRHFNGSVVS